MKTDGVWRLCLALALDSRLGIGTAFPGLLGGGGVCAGGVCVGSYSMSESQAVRTDNALPKVS